MAGSTRSRIPTPRDLAEEEYLLDWAGGRRYCPVHRTQQMIPLWRGKDVCPVCPADDRQSQQPEPTTDLG